VLLYATGGFMANKEYLQLETRTKDISENVCNQLGSYFNYVREKVRKLSLRELSKISGISIALVSAFEDGKKLPRIETIIKLMIALNIPFCEVFGHKLAGMEFKFNPEITANNSCDNPLRQYLSSLGYDKDEIKDIIKYTDFIKFNRK